MTDSTPKSYSSDPTLYLYTSLSSGSSTIVTATSRLETILRANKISFQALDVATDEKARMLWGRRAGKRKLPGLVRLGMVVGDLDEIEEWNEYGEIQQHLSFDSTATNISAASTLNTSSKPATSDLAESPSIPPSTISTGTPLAKPAPLTEPAPESKTTSSTAKDSLATAMQQAGLEAAKKATEIKSKVKSALGSTTSSTTGSDLQTLDNSTPPDTHPPISSTNAEEATAPISTASHREENVPSATGTGPVEENTMAATTSVPLPSNITILPLRPHPSSQSVKTQHRDSDIVPASSEEIAAVEASNTITEDPAGEAAEQATTHSTKALTNDSIKGPATHNTSSSVIVSTDSATATTTINPVPAPARRESTTPRIQLLADDGTASDFPSALGESHLKSGNSNGQGFAMPLKSPMPIARDPNAPQYEDDPAEPINKSVRVPTFNIIPSTPGHVDGVSRGVGTPRVGAFGAQMQQARSALDVKKGESAASTYEAPSKEGEKGEIKEGNSTATESI